MKTLEVNFKIGGYCSIYVEVPEDYQIPCTDPVEYWRDLKEKFGNQIEVDPFELDDDTGQEFLASNVNIKRMVLDHFLWISVFGDDGDEEFDINLDHVPINR